MVLGKKHGTSYLPYTSKDPSYKFNHKTNKTDSWAHGFGLAIIEDIASKYDGSCQWIDNGDVFESVVMVAVG